MNFSLYNKMVKAARNPTELARFIADMTDEVVRADSLWSAGATDGITTPVEDTRWWLLEFIEEASELGAVLIWVEMPEMEINPDNWAISLRALGQPRQEDDEAFEEMFGWADDESDADAEDEDEEDIMALYWRLEPIELAWSEQALEGLERLAEGFKRWAERDCPSEMDSDRPLMLVWAKYLQHMQQAVPSGGGPLVVCVAMHGPDEPQWVTRMSAGMDG